MNDLLFAYGTLREEKIRFAITGKKSFTLTDRIVGFELSEIQEGEITYPALVPGNNTIDGLVFVVTDEDLVHLDAYEGPEYKRQQLVSQAGHEVWVYLKNDTPNKGIE